MAFNEATARWESHEYDEPGLGQVLADERFRQLRLQRTVAAASGITQPKLSAYERGRLIPSWEVFVRVLAAHLLGTGEQVELIYVSVEGDPERLDEFATAIANRNRAVTAIRGGGVRRVRVAPMEDIYGEL